MAHKASVADIRAIRAESGAGVMDIKRAIEDAEGDLDKARELLGQRGSRFSAKRAERETREGLVAAYVHPGRPLGALLELNCETDFVARTQDFTTLAHDLAMHIAAMAPTRISDDDAQAADDGPALLSQPWFRDGSQTVEQVIQMAVARLGENIQVGRFSRFEI
ncbi:MAG: elongation factor Ts [Chloroflexi bacterium]|nr:elongation factor Ts [Chloroflexota bacterium]MCY3957877.1 elongation factor Ts [Chloroflexota bacterium]